MLGREGLHQAAEFGLKHTRKLAFSHSGACLAVAGGSRLITIIDCLSLRASHHLKVRPPHVGQPAH